MFSWFRDLIYPRICITCHSLLNKTEPVICLGCERSLPKTKFYNIEINPVQSQFLGRLPLLHATSILNFEKESNLQLLLHALKYDNRKDAGIWLGQQMAVELKQYNWLQSIDALVPLPLHKNKEAKRGYNQSLCLCEGISDILKIPILNDLVKRTEENVSQTKKNKYERWENVKNIFECKTKSNNYNHVLIIDDVISTGATIEACAQSLIDVGYNVSICSVATILQKK